MPIDALKLARRLRDAGFNEAQAEAVADAVREGTEGANLATKGDLALTSAELRSEIAEVRAEVAAVRGDMREMEQRLILRITNEITGIRNEIAALKTDLLTRMCQMILGAVLMNAVAMAGLMFAFAKLLGY
ncbi:MAG: coiled-coil domain-containing protein [Alphaproteobacteria bacterium]